MRLSSNGARGGGRAFNLFMSVKVTAFGNLRWKTEVCYITRTVHNNGALTLPCSKKIADLSGYSGSTSRYVDLLYSTLEDWKNELRVSSRE
jgi:hypothetical protein